MSNATAETVTSLPGSRVNPGRINPTAAIASTRAMHLTSQSGAPGIQTRSMATRSAGLESPSSPAAIRNGTATSIRAAQSAMIRAFILGEVGRAPSVICVHFLSAGIMRARVPSLRTNWLKSAAPAWRTISTNIATLMKKCRSPRFATPERVSIPVIPMARRQA